jgi:hypothetical protein
MRWPRLASDSSSPAVKEPVTANIQNLAGSVYNLSWPATQVKQRERWRN